MNVELTVTMKDDVRRLMQQIDNSPSAYREFAGSATAGQASPWTLLQAVLHTDGSAEAPAPTPALPETASWPTPAHLAVGNAPATAPAESSFSPRTAAPLPPTAVSPAQGIPERPQESAGNPFGKLFQNASANGGDAHREKAEGSLKSLLREIGSCR
ncbi:hypothetical protein SAMN04244572_01777 [Azotobacter beijerinckii]|uniref:Uncharacterized protein n=2 Tax=Azotobacter beijerinckii TaxID=170623 RepID=A0A1H6TU79_9GAMM|nr:hypothetical protein SAMN04244572_01777 [Azotobacter beijerinckii]